MIFVYHAKCHRLLVAILFLAGLWTLNVGFSQPVAVSFDASPKKVLGKEYPLVGITDAIIINDTSFAVLTSTFPAIHLFEGDTYRSWGREGNGPDAFDNPAHLEVYEDTLFALDFRPGACKIISYSLQGGYLVSKPIRGAGMCYGFKMSSHYKIVETGSWGSREKELLLIEQEPRSLTTFTEPKPATLHTPKGPMRGFSLQNPFDPQPVWEVNIEEELMIWDGKNSVFMVYQLPDLD